MAGRPLSSSKEIVSELSKITDRMLGLDEKVDKIDEKLDEVDEKMDKIIMSLPNQPTRLTDAQKEAYISAGLPVPESSVQDTIVSLETRLHNKIDGIVKGATQVVGGIVIIILVIFLVVSSFDGCAVKPQPGPSPEPVDVLIQLDKTENELYQKALSFLQDDWTLKQKKDSLMFNLGTMSQKKKIIDAFPNEKIEVLQ